jgi:hypothetical protein
MVATAQTRDLAAGAPAALSLPGPATGWTEAERNRRTPPSSGLHSMVAADIGHVRCAIAGSADLALSRHGLAAGARVRARLALECGVALSIPEIMGARTLRDLSVWPVLQARSTPRSSRRSKLAV